MAPTTFNGVNEAGLVPKPVAQEILKGIQEDSIVQKLAGQTPMPLQGNAIAVQTGHIEAGVVGEGEAKPVGSTEYAVKTMKPIKVAAIAVVSKELRMANPLGILENITGDLKDAVTRAFDLAVLYGKDARSGSAIPGVESVNGTTHRVELGTTTQADGGLSGDILAGYDLVIENSRNHNFTGFAAAPQFRSQLLGATDLQGKPVYQQGLNLADQMGSTFGLPTAYSRAVTGNIGAATDSNVRAFGGDWSQLKYGFAETMTLSRSDQATISDGATTYNLWQQNLEAFLVEAIFGWVITDENAFVAYDKAVEAAA